MNAICVILYEFVRNTTVIRRILEGESFIKLQRTLVIFLMSTRCVYCCLIKVISVVSLVAYFLVKHIRLINDIWVHLSCQLCLLTSEYQIYGAYISIYTATLTCICTCSIRPSCARTCLHVITQYNDTSPNDCTLLSKHYTVKMNASLPPKANISTVHGRTIIYAIYNTSIC